MNAEKLKKANKISYAIGYAEAEVKNWQKFEFVPEDQAREFGRGEFICIPSGGVTKQMMNQLSFQAVQALELKLAELKRDLDGL